MTPLFKISAQQIERALVSLVLMVIVLMLTYILSVGSIFNIDYAHMIDIGVMSFLTGLVSILNSFLTGSGGKIFTDTVSPKNTTGV